jgi:N-acetyl-anhydromuramyl-L-alanine amidase AmpD
MISYEFIRAKNFSPGRKAPVSLIVVHTMEVKKIRGAARNIAKWFAGSAAPKASPHFCVDAEEVIQCVPLADAAWCAPGANEDGLHIEHAGYAKQTDAEWADEYNGKMLLLSAQLAAELAQLYSIPVERVLPEQLGAGKEGTVRGFCGHIDVTTGRKHGDHWDPGPHFPWDRYLAEVRAQLERIRSANG